jgi:hypothetical protein
MSATEIYEYSTIVLLILGGFTAFLRVNATTRESRSWAFVSRELSGVVVMGVAVVICKELLISISLPITEHSAAETSVSIFTILAVYFFALVWSGLVYLAGVIAGFTVLKWVSL